MQHVLSTCADTDMSSRELQQACVYTGSQTRGEYANAQTRDLASQHVSEQIRTYAKLRKTVHPLALGVRAGVHAFA